MSTPKHDHEQLWERIHAALDQHQDPLDNPLLAAALGDAPELAEELVRLMESLAYLTPEPVRPRRSAALLALAASCEFIIEHQNSAGLRRLVHNNSGLTTEFKFAPHQRPPHLELAQTCPTPIAPPS